MNDTPPVPPAGDDRPTAETPRVDETRHDQLRHDDTAAFPGGFPAYAGTPGTPGAAGAAEKPRRRGPVTASVLVAALVLGGGAGVGGAAAYDAWLDEDEPAFSTSGSAQTSQVVDSDPVEAAEGTVQAAAESVLPSVVRINVRGAEEAGSGSGIILSSDGTILTNFHVIEPAVEDGSISVDFSDGSHAVAEVVGTDPLTDTAVIRAQDVDGLVPATLGESGELQVGQEVVAIGSPFGLDATVTSGIVSALDRPVDVGTDGEGNATVYPAVQTDAAINPGNSGGPLVDLEGRVVGINSSIRTTGSASPFGGSSEGGSIGLGFAIPIDEVLPIVEQMVEGETPTHARLGITVSDVGVPAQGDITPEDLEDLQEQQEQQQAEGLVTDGAQVQTVGEGSTAGEAGLEEGDVITRVDDTLITSADSLVATIRSYRPGDEVTVTFERDGEEQTTTLVLDSDAS